MLSVCNLTSSFESVNQFSWYKNLSHLKVTPTLRFTFNFHAVCVLSLLLLSLLTSFHDIRISHILRSPLHCALRLISMLSVCPLTSSLEPVNQFSWYRNLSHLNVTPTLYFTFDFHAFCVLSLRLLSQLISFHDIRISHTWRSPLHCALRLISMLSLFPLTSSIEPVDQFSWYKTLSHLKVTPTLRFTFDFHAACVSSHFLYWASWPVFTI